MYTCQLFLRCRREIFILGVLGFLKTTRTFPKISEDVRRFPKKSEVFRRRPKSFEGVKRGNKRELAPSAFHFKNQRSRGRYCHLFILHMVFVPYILYFRIPHKTLCLPPKFCINYCFQMLLGTLHIPKSI